MCARRYHGACREVLRREHAFTRDTYTSVYPADTDTRVTILKRNERSSFYGEDSNRVPLAASIVAAVTFAHGRVPLRLTSCLPDRLPADSQTGYGRSVNRGSARARARDRSTVRCQNKIRAINKRANKCRNRFSATRARFGTVCMDSIVETRYRSTNLLLRRCKSD